MATSTQVAGFVKLTQSIVSTYDGDADHKDKAETYTYNNTSGNVTQKVEYGEVTGSDDGTFVDTGTDDFTTTYTYATSSTSTIMSLLASQSTLDNGSSKVQESKFYYDNLAINLVNLGNLTKREDWVASSTYVDTEKTYNNLGLVATEKDQRDKTTTYSYDSNSLYPTTVTNPVGHISQYVYDYSLGKAATSTDPNGNIFVSVYDGLDRLVAKKQPDPSATSTLQTALAYTYTNADKIQALEILDATTTVDTYMYLDGLGRKKQTRKEAEDSNYSVTDFIYNNIGLLQKETIPYFSSGSASTTVSTTTTLFINYNYDALKRPTSTVDSVGTVTYTYDQWVTTVTDKRARSKCLYHDAYENLTRVDENCGTSGVVTDELYDTSLYDDSNLVAYYRMEGNGNDSKGSNNGTSYNMTYGSSYGKFGEGGNFVAANDSYIDLGNPSPLDITGNITVMAWIQPQALGSYRVFISKGTDNGGHHIQYILNYHFGLNKFYWVSSNSNNSTYYDAYATTPSTGNWYHVAGVMNGSNMLLYVNGTQVATGSAVSSLLSDTANAYIGQQGDGTNNVDAYMDEVAIFNRALTGQEISDYYNGNLPARTVPNVYTTTYTYNGLNKLTNITDAAGNVRNFTYDGLGRRLTAQDMHASGDGTFGTYTYTYDDAGNMTSKLDPKSQTINYTYDDINRQLTEDYTGQSGTEVTYTYDSCTQGKGRMCTASSSIESTLYLYNALGQLVTSTSTISGTAYGTSYAYDRQGNQLTITSPDNSKVQYTYNNAGQVETVQRKESTDGSYQDLVLDLDYGPHEKITYQENANCTETTNTYDAAQLYRLTSKITTTGCGEEESLMAPFPGGEEESLLNIDPEIKNPPLTPYSSATSTPPIGNPPAPTSTKDSIASSSEVSLNSEPGFFTRTWKSIANGFSKAGNFVVGLFTPKTAYAAAVELYETSLYNDSNLKAYYRMEGDSHDSKGTNDGTDNNMVYNSSYGKFGEGGGFVSANDGYINLGNPAALDITGNITVMAWIKAQSLGSYRSFISKGYDGGGHHIQYALHYHLALNKFYWVSSNSNNSSYYDAYNQVPSVDTWYHVVGVMNGSNMLLYINGSIAATGSAISSLLSDSNNVYIGQFGDGSQNVDAYMDDVAIFNRALSAQEISDYYNGNLLPRETTIQNIEYTYDANGNITDTVDNSDTDTEKTLHYTYDDLNRLTSASSTAATYGSNYKYSYTYDGLGNMLSRVENNATTTYTYATGTAAYLNPHAVATTTVATSTSFTYDNNGNLTSTKYGTSTVSSFTWDYNNRLTNATTSGVVSSYAYDPTGQRVKQTVGATTTIYSTKFYSTDGTTPTKHIYLPDGTLIATVTGTGTTSEVSYVHVDHLGGANVVTDSGGAVSEIFDGYPYGGTRLDEKSGSFSERFKFAQLERDDNGLDYARARYYNSSRGQFVSQDPSFLAIGDNQQLKQITNQELQQFLSNPQNLNSYSYVLNNPLVNTDPTGQASTNAWLSNPLGTALQVGGLKAISNIYTWVNPNKTISNDLFNRSLSLNPSNITIADDGGKYSNVITEIRSSKEYQSFASNAIKQANAQNSLEFSYSYFGDSQKDKQDGSQGGSINFTSGDLSTSIGGTLQTNIYGKRMDNGLWSVGISIQDEYNFDYHGYRYYKNSPVVTTGNNAMLIPQATGAISRYNIEINFKDIK